jgi:hypothetical protein
MWVWDVRVKTRTYLRGKNYGETTAKTKTETRANTEILASPE